MVVFKYELGSEAKDRITGLEGVITGIVIHLNGCIRYNITSKKRTVEGKMIEDWVDEQQIILLKEPPKVKAPKEGPGGPHKAPQFRPDPARG
jgi:quinol monooxygenase YgiN